MLSEKVEYMYSSEKWKRADNSVTVTRWTGFGRERSPSSQWPELHYRHSIWFSQTEEFPWAKDPRTGKWDLHPRRYEIQWAYEMVERIDIWCETTSNIYETIWCLHHSINYRAHKMQDVVVRRHIPPRVPHSSPLIPPSAPQSPSPVIHTPVVATWITAPPYRRYWWDWHGTLDMDVWHTCMKCNAVMIGQVFMEMHPDGKRVLKGHGWVFRINCEDGNSTKIDLDTSHGFGTQSLLPRPHGIIALQGPHHKTPADIICYLHPPSPPQQ